MDKELLRITIIAVGGMVVVGIVLWHTLKNQKSNQHINDSDITDLSATHLTNATQPQNPNFVAPSIIQFNIAAKKGQNFNGKDLVDAFALKDLKYGSMNVFERLDENKKVHYAVANMVEPGTFPDANFEQYHCPGIVFFLQPMQLDNPLSVFDELITTIDFLSARLDGIVLDHDRQPLTQQVMQQLRISIANIKK